MPSVSKKQHNLMAAVAHNPKFAKKVGIPQSVGKEFNKADKGKQFKRGGEMGIKNTNGSFDGLKASDVENMHKRNAEKKRAAVAAKKSAAKPNMKMSAMQDKRLMSQIQKLQAKKSSAPAAKPAAPAPKPTSNPMDDTPEAKLMRTPAMKKGGKVCGMKEGGKVAGMKAGGVKKELPTAKDLGSMNMKKGGRVKCMAGGGYVRAADGVTKKGKTKGKII
jgi:hypothetical protein